jgi:putative lipoic acid-binding regulatory protein
MNLDPFPKPFSCREKPKIDYPCSWVYKVIGSDEKAMRSAIETVLGTENLLITSSHASSGGKYISLNAEIVVNDDESRLSGHQNLKNHPAIKVVM